MIKSILLGLGLAAATTGAFAAPAAPAVAPTHAAVAVHGAPAHVLLSNIDEDRRMAELLMGSIDEDRACAERLS